MSIETQYSIAGVDVSDVRNRNEARIAEKMRDALEKMGNPAVSPQAVRDAYALALNLLPARYKQSGTIILREPIRESHLEEATVRALKQVLNNPKK
ncbi:MAG: late competence development ComFB family protein [Deltaproteobacteria bacterium]|nr:late competence development ComFB family protein [Deltaproteobacteria bacterium]